MPLIMNRAHGRQATVVPVDANRYHFSIGERGDLKTTKAMTPVARGPIAPIIKKRYGYGDALSFSDGRWAANRMAFAVPVVSMTVRTGQNRIRFGVDVSHSRGYG
jgi:hypothetical protein